MLRSLLVGLKSVNASAYGGWDGQNGCWGAELDVDNVERILKPLGYQNRILKTKAATAGAILAELERAAAECQSGDTFVIYFSGHGGQKQDVSGDETDARDETLVAYDREVLDDELNTIWVKFRPGVRLIMLSDSCNSGSNYRLLNIDIPTSTPVRLLARMLSGKGDPRAVMKAQMIHYGGCRDGFSSSGYVGGGAFTQALCQTWNDGKFQGDHAMLYEGIRSRIKSGQAVQLNKYGPVGDSFLKSRPFGDARGEPGAVEKGGIQSVRCVVELKETHLSSIRSAITKEAAAVLLEALDDALSQRPGGASVVCTGSSRDGISCTATVTITW